MSDPTGLTAYVVDSAQRSILFLDVLRRRGNQFIEHYQAGKPPVLVFDHEVVLDGADLPRPCNYLLLRIKPEAGTPTDPRKRPFVIVDPRAGHGPGIGGSKEVSQVGVALRAGHPVYFVSFRPLPVPGQTLADIAEAEWRFLNKVAELHPEAEAKPAIVGNCQAGWAIMILSAYAPEQSSVIGIAGAPLAYWSGVEGKNPLRYFGGLTGGNWLSALAADLGAGTFDGVSLVSNFEALNPANALIGKPYNLYAKVDTEAERYLGFERWWGGYFFMTADEILQITSELFIGNKLTAGRIIAPNGTPIDLRAIRAPILVVASHGDNITPPQQALNWILDLYDDVGQIQANEQTIIYTVHPTIGHLGIFVSAKVAVKEHAEFVASLELIETLPPGLYEMVIEEVREAGSCADDRHLEYHVRFEARTLDAIRALDDGREDERPFSTVARFSEINEGLYQAFLGPVLRALVSEPVAEAARLLHPSRQRHLFFSDWNPWMRGIEQAALLVRENRAALAPHDPYRAYEAWLVGHAEKAIEDWTDARDRLIEASFKAIWGQPFLQALAGEAASHADVDKPAISRERAFRELAALKLKGLGARETSGSFAEAVMRIIHAATRASGVIDARAYHAAREVWLSHPRLGELSGPAFRAEAKEAALMVALDEERALAALPLLLPSEADREEALDVVRRIVGWRQTVRPEVQAVIDRVAAILGVGTPAATAETAEAEVPAEEAEQPVAAKTRQRRATATRRPGTRRTTKSA